MSITAVAHDSGSPGTSGWTVAAVTAALAAFATIATEITGIDQSLKADFDDGIVGTITQVCARRTAGSTNASVIVAPRLVGQYVTLGGSGQISTVRPNNQLYDVVPQRDTVWRAYGISSGNWVAVSSGSWGQTIAVFDRIIANNEFARDVSALALAIPGSVENPKC